MADKGQIEALLINAGLGPVMVELTHRPLQQTVSLPLSSVVTAKRIQRLLYQWLKFYPEVKAGVKVRVVEATVLLMPTAGPEKRGRRRVL